MLLLRLAEIIRKFLTIKLAIKFKQFLNHWESVSTFVEHKVVIYS